VRLVRVDMANPSIATVHLLWSIENMFQKLIDLGLEPVIIFLG